MSKLTIAFLAGSNSPYCLAADAKNLGKFCVWELGSADQRNGLLCHLLRKFGGYSASNIDGGSNWFHMLRSHARRYSAQMVELQSFGYSTNFLLVNRSMSKLRFAAFDSAAKNSAITSLGLRLAVPYPAWSLIAPILFMPEVWRKPMPYLSMTVEISHEFSGYIAKLAAGHLGAWHWLATAAHAEARWIRRFHIDISPAAAPMAEYIGRVFTLSAISTGSFVNFRDRATTASAIHGHVLPYTSVGSKRA